MVFLLPKLFDKLLPFLIVKLALEPQMILQRRRPVKQCIYLTKQFFVVVLIKKGRDARESKVTVHENIKY